MEKSVLRALQACPLFAGLSAKEVESAINMVEYHLVKYGKKELYAKEGYPVENVDIVVSGGIFFWKMRKNNMAVHRKTDDGSFYLLRKELTCDD